MKLITPGQWESSEKNQKRRRVDLGVNNNISPVELPESEDIKDLYLLRDKYSL